MTAAVADHFWRRLSFILSLEFIYHLNKNKNDSTKNEAGFPIRFVVFFFCANLIFMFLNVISLIYWGHILVE